MAVANLDDHLRGQTILQDARHNMELPKANPDAQLKAQTTLQDDQQNMVLPKANLDDQLRGQTTLQDARHSMELAKANLEGQLKHKTIHQGALPPQITVLAVLNKQMKIAAVGLEVNQEPKTQALAIATLLHKRNISLHQPSTSLHHLRVQARLRNPVRNNHN